MSFLAPERLFLLAVVAVLAGTYIVLQLRGSKFAMRFTNLELLENVAPKRAKWRRHVVAGAFLLALVALVVSLARPVRTVEVATEKSTLVLAIDTSISMRSMDVSPSRLDAAREAATDFVDLVPEGIEVGLVAFDGSARLEAPASDDRDDVKGAIDDLSLGEGTAIGEAIYLGLDSILEAQPEEGEEPAADANGEEEPPGRIILMSDGETTAGRANEEASAAALAAGIPVSTIAYGTDAGSVVYQGEEIPVPVNRPALREVADATGGTFFEAATGEELQAAFENLGTAIAFETEERELALWFVGLGLLLATGAGVGSLFWFSRLP